VCLAVPGKIVKINGDIAKVDYGGIVRNANISLVDVKEGDYVIVHAGFAIQVIDEREAKETIKIFREILKNA